MIFSCGVLIIFAYVWAILRRYAVPVYLLIALVVFGYELRAPDAAGPLSVLRAWACAMIWPWRIWVHARHADVTVNPLMAEDWV